MLSSNSALIGRPWVVRRTWMRVRLLFNQREILQLPPAWPLAKCAFTVSGQPSVWVCCCACHIVYKSSPKEELAIGQWQAASFGNQLARVQYIGLYSGRIHRFHHATQEAATGPFLCTRKRSVENKLKWAKAEAMGKVCLGRRFSRPKCLTARSIAFAVTARLCG